MELHVKLSLILGFLQKIGKLTEDIDALFRLQLFQLFQLFQLLGKCGKIEYYQYIREALP